MADIKDLVSKILALGQEASTEVEPEYLAAKAALDSAKAELKNLQSLKTFKGLTGPQLGRYQALTSEVIPKAQNTHDMYAFWLDSQKEAKQSLDDYQAQLNERLTGMSPSAAATYASLDPLTDGQKWGDYVNSLRRVPADQIPHAKSLQAQMRKFVRENPSVTPAQMEAEAGRLVTGDLYGPDDDPRAIESLRRLKAGPMARGWQNFRDHWTAGGATALGYAALDLSGGIVSAATPTLTGGRYTVEARERAGLGLLPGALGMVGTGVGMAFGAPFAGAAIGGAVGTGVQGILGAQSERRESLRLDSEDWSQILGRGTTAAKDFVDTLETSAKRMGVPVVELAQNVQALSRNVGSLTSGGIFAQTQLQSQLGDLYAPTIGAVGQFAAAHPYDAGFRNALRTGVGLPQSALGGALAAAAEGNRDQAYSLLMVSGQTNLSPTAQALQAQITASRTANFQSGNPVFDWIRSLPGSKANRYVQTLQDQLSNMPDAKKFTVAPGRDKALVDSLADSLPQSTFLAGQYGQEASVYGSYGQQQLALGLGAAGLRPNVQAQVADLQSQRGQLLSSEGSIQSAVNRVGATPELNAMLLSIRSQLADVRGQIIGANSGLFQEGVSEREARFSGQGARLGVSGEAILYGGGSVFSAGYARNIRQQANIDRQKARYDLGLAKDHSNFLSPMDRESLKTQAAQEDFQARFGVKNAYQLQKIGQSESTSTVRQADISIEIARARAAGDVTGAYTAQNKLLDEQTRLQKELQTRLGEGNLTLQQRQQLMQRIKEIDAQTIEGRRQAMDEGLIGVSDVAGAASTSAYLKGQRATRFGGSSAASYDASMKGYDYGLKRVQALQARADEPGLDPMERIRRQTDVDRAKADNEDQMLGAAGTFNEPSKFETQRMQLEHQLGRQEKSVFEPGSVFQTEGRLAGMAQKTIKDIDAQIARNNANPRMTHDQRDYANSSLYQRREEEKDKYFDANQDLNFGWMDRITTMSVNAPSFAPRIMPSPMNVADIAELRGLGPMSARVFGFRKHSSYEGAAMMGRLPADQNMAAYGLRPGDWPEGEGPNGTSLVGASSPSPVVGANASPLTDKLEQLFSAMLQVFQNGVKVTVTQINPTTGQQAAHTQNSQGNYDATGIMRGGVKPPNYPGRR